MAGKVIAFDQNLLHSTFMLSDYNNPDDFDMLPKEIGEYGTGSFRNNILRPFDLCIDAKTGDSHWFIPEEGWV